MEPIVNPIPRSGRNEKCPCGSGHKFKKCCGKQPTDEQRARWARLTDAFKGKSNV